MNFAPLQRSLLFRISSSPWSPHSSSTSPVCPPPDFCRDICCSNYHVCLLRHDQVVPGVNRASVLQGVIECNRKAEDSQPSCPDHTIYKDHQWKCKEEKKESLKSQKKGKRNTNQTGATARGCRQTWRPSTDSHPAHLPFSSLLNSWWESEASKFPVKLLL